VSSIAASRLTLEEFEQLDDTRGLELVDGVVEELDMGAESLTLADVLGDEMKVHARQTRAGLVITNDIGVDLRGLGTELLRKPDGMFIRKGRLDAGTFPSGWLRIVPDIAWEVVSPGDRAETLERKLQDYREAGFPLVWVIFPGTRSGRIQDATGDSRFLDEDGVLDGGDSLPGFRLRLGDLFAKYDATLAELLY
jgi:Uma2 family endonuclease